MESYRFLSYLFSNDSIRPFTIHTLSPAYKVDTASEELSGDFSKLYKTKILSATHTLA